MIDRIKKSIKFRLRSKLETSFFDYIDLRWRLGSGLVVRIKSQMEWILYNDIFVEGEYDIPITETLNGFSDSNDSTINVLDLGSNVGFFTLRLFDLAKKRGLDKKLRLTAIEASIELFNVYQKRLSFLLSNQVIQICGLVGKKKGSEIFYEGSFHGMNSIFSSSASTRKAKLEYIDLDEKLVSFAKIHLLKIDIEGSELSFFSHYPKLLAQTDRVVVELHPLLCNINTCRELLRSAGFLKHRVLRRAANLSVEYFTKVEVL